MQQLDKTFKATRGVWRQRRGFGALAACLEPVSRRLMCGR